MYYCLKCNETHTKLLTGKVFTTGYILYEDKRVPLGICSSGKAEATQKEYTQPRV